MAADSAGSRDELTRQAEKYLRQGRIDQALECYQRLADFSPTDWNVVKQLADLCERVGQREAAAFRFAQLADHLFQEGFHTKASALYKKVLKLDSGNEHAWWQLAELALQQKLRVDARHALSQVLELRRRRRNTAGIDEVLLRLAELDPDDVTARASAAQVARTDESPADALARLRQLGTDLDAAGDAGAADTVWREVLVRDPGAADVRMRLIRHAVKGGDMPGALQLAAALDAGSPDQLALHLEVTHAAGLHADLHELVVARVAAGDREHEILGWVERLASRALREACVVGAVDALRAAGAAPAAGMLIAAFTSATADAPASLFLLWVELCVDAGLDQLNAAQQGLAAAYLQQGHVSDARAVAEDLILRQPDDGECRGLLLEIYRTGGEADPESALALLLSPPAASWPIGEHEPAYTHDVDLESSIAPDPPLRSTPLGDNPSSDSSAQHEHHARQPADVRTMAAGTMAPEEAAQAWTRPKVELASAHLGVTSAPAVPGPVSSMDAWLAEATAPTPLAAPSVSVAAAPAGFDWAALLGREVEHPACDTRDVLATVVDAPHESPIVVGLAGPDALPVESMPPLAVRLDAHDVVVGAPGTPSASGWAAVDSVGERPVVELAQLCDTAGSAATEAAPVRPSVNGDAPLEDGSRAPIFADVEQSLDVASVAGSDPAVEFSDDEGQRSERVAGGAEERPDALPVNAPVAHPSVQQEDEDEEIDLTELLEQLRQFDPVLPEMPRRVPSSEDTMTELAEAVEPVESVFSNQPTGPDATTDQPCPGADDAALADADLSAVFADMQERTGDRSLASQQLAAGRVFAAAGLAAEAARAFERASSELRSRFEAGQALAELHRSRGQLHEAVRWYAVAASAPVADAAMRRAVLYDLSETLEALGETERALGVVLDLLSEVEDYRDARARADRLLSVDAGG